MNKVIIIGCPGSGKSTFGRKLAYVTGLPLYHLDMLYWNSDKTTVERDEFVSRLQKVMDETKWIIDGNYGSTMELRMEACDTVFFLDYSTDECLTGIEERRSSPRTDMPWVEDGEPDDEFINFVKSYNAECRPDVIRLLEKYSDKKIYIFNSRDEADKFLHELR